jgi:histidinol-phosphate/aromatic aminotransferase/cobyric acid decarboxylase-like protein
MGKVWHSEGNFVFAQFHDIDSVLEMCQQNGILVRHFVGAKMYYDCLRITVGLEKQNQAFLEALKTLEHEVV